MICDTHMHSIHSFDGSEQIDNMCQAAIARRIPSIAITDHAEAMEKVSYSAFERERITKQMHDIEHARKKYGDQLEILFGCELGQPHLNPAYSRAIIDEFDFDYVIGSIHFYKGNVDLYDVKYTAQNVDDYICEYFEETLEMLAVGGFQCLGHLDYIMRRLQTCYDGIPTYHGYEAYIERILSQVVEKGRALEINTSGLRKWLGCIGLEPWVLRMFRDMGGRYVTIGSDAHAACDIGEGFLEAKQLLLDAGFSSCTYFKNKKPIEIKID